MSTKNIYFLNYIKKKKIKLHFPKKNVRDLIEQMTIKDTYFIKKTKKKASRRPHKNINCGLII